MIRLIAQLAFYAVMLILALFSLAMMYVLLRHGQSKFLGLILSAIYLFIMFSLFTAALINFNQIPFSEL